MSSSSPTDLHVEIVTPRKVAWKGTALDVHISNLRKKIGDGYIRTVRGVGYMVQAERA